MLTQFALYSDIDKHSARIIVTDVKNNDRAITTLIVDVFRRLIRQRHAGKAAGRIKADCQFFAVVLDNTRY